MTLCPIAMLAGCGKCPAFKLCPLKGVIGDYEKPFENKQAAEEDKGGAKRESRKARRKK